MSVANKSNNNPMYAKARLEKTDSPKQSISVFIFSLMKQNNTTLYMQ